MNCEELRTMIDEEGAPVTGDASAHVHDCEGCADFYADWQEVHRTLRAMDDIDTPPFLHTRLMAHVREAAAEDAHKKESWRFSLKKIWAGPLLVLFLGMVLGGYGLMQVLRPKVAEAPTRQHQDSDQKAKRNGGTPESTSRRSQVVPEALKDEQPLQHSLGFAPERKAATEPAPAPPPSVSAPAIPESGAKREESGTLFGSPQEKDQAGKAAYQPMGNRPDEGAADKKGESAGSIAVKRGGGPIASMQPASARAPEKAEDAPSEAAAPSDAGFTVVCTLSPIEGDGPFITLQLPAEAAPPSGGVWTVDLTGGPAPRVRDSLGRTLKDPAATIAAIVRPLRVPPGSYRLKRIS